jgi:hypothetical protein
MDTRLDDPDDANRCDTWVDEVTQPDLDLTQLEGASRLLSEFPWRP